jgi:hypothetical protein
MTTFALVLMLSANQLLQVGTFPTLDLCQRAATASVMIQRGSDPPPNAVNFICVQASDDAVAAPLAPK